LSFIKKNQRIILYQIENSQVFTTLLFCADSGKNYVIFIELYMKGDCFACISQQTIYMYMYIGIEKYIQVVFTIFTSTVDK
jgi:hypothetical protein